MKEFVLKDNKSLEHINNKKWWCLLCRYVYVGWLVRITPIKMIYLGEDGGIQKKIFLRNYKYMESRISPFDIIFF